MQIEAQVLSMQDKDYQRFSQKLLPTVAPERIIGVRAPQLRKLARTIRDLPQTQAFLDTLPHTHYEEDLLHGYLLEQIRAYEPCIARVNAFLPYVDNWAVCDCTSPKALIREPERLLDEIDAWLCSGRTYTVRYAVGQLMRWFLDERFDPAYPQKVAAIQSEAYYVNMMRAWYFATALAKQPEAALAYLETQRLDVWTHNKTIQKAVESYRVPDEMKAYLRTLRRK